MVRVAAIARVVDAGGVAIVFACSSGEARAGRGFGAVADLHGAGLREGFAGLAEFTGTGVGCESAGGEAGALAT